MTSRVQIRKITPFRNAAGTVLGFLDAEMPSGMIINGMRLMIGAKGGFWIALPAVKQTDHAGNPRLGQNGTALWSPILEFRDRAAQDRFRDLVLDALRQAHPEAFEDTTATRHKPVVPARRHKNPYRPSRGETVDLPDDNVVELFREPVP